MNTYIDLKGLVNVFGQICENQNTIITERLILKKQPILDSVSTEYLILLKESQEEIGKVLLIYDGEIWYKIYKPFRKNGYATEAVSKLIEISTLTYFYLSIKFTNIASIKVAKKLGFTYNGIIGKSLIFEKTKTKSE